MSRAGSTRWCPTPEQLMILEEMYRSGVRTPNASQIQHITTHLSYYGKIEGKNVFYWFQNHKARERQKLRRKLSKQLQLQQHHQLMMHCQVPNHPQQLFHCIDQSPLAGASSLSFYNSAKVLPQEGLMTEEASSKMMNYTWKLGIQERVEKEKSLMGMYGRDWMMLVDHHHVAPPSSLLQPSDWSKPPLKTLELFPITSTNLKEECNNKNSSKLN